MYFFRAAIFSKVVLQNPTASIPARLASTGGKGNTRNKQSKPTGRRRGIRVEDGDVVHPTYVLATQHTTPHIKFYPGSNVYADSKMTLYAACNGNIHITDEVFIPLPDSEYNVEEMALGSVIFKKYINVIPEKKPVMFKLVEMI